MASCTRRIRALTLVLTTILLLTPLNAVILPAIAAGSGGQDTRTPIKHVIEVMMENHSFDNMFGVYPEEIRPGGTFPAANITIPANLVSSRPSGLLKSVPVGRFSTPDPIEGYGPYHTDWNHGRMNGFANGSGPQSMYYFTSAQIAPEFDLAEEFSLADRYFASYLSETDPNRLMSLAGYTPITSDQNPPPEIPVAQSIFYELASHDILWKYYVQTPNGIPYPLNYFQGITRYSANIAPWSGFVSDVNSGSLPPVSFVMPVGGGASGYSQHPSDNVLIGEMWLLYIVDIVMHSAEWNSTAIFINYDEGGGYYDQVAPPATCGVQLGFRVPMFLISPYAKEDYVSDTVMNHASILAFIDYNWRLPALNRFVSYSNLPLDMFNFNRTYPGGFIRRQPINMAGFFGNLVPSSISFGYGSSREPVNLSSYFPMPLQISAGYLPYTLNGSGESNLSMQNTSVFVPANYGVYAASYYVTLGTFFAIISVLSVIGVFLKRRRKNK